MESVRKRISGRSQGSEAEDWDELRIRFDPEEIKAYLESRKGLKRGDRLVNGQEGGRKP